MGDSVVTLLVLTSGRDPALAAMELGAVCSMAGSRLLDWRSTGRILDPGSEQALCQRFHPCLLSCRFAAVGMSGGVDQVSATENALGAALGRCVLTRAAYTDVVEGSSLKNVAANGAAEPDRFVLVGRRMTPKQEKLLRRKVWAGGETAEGGGGESGDDAGQVGKQHVVVDMRGLAGGLEASCAGHSWFSGRVFARGGNREATRRATKRDHDASAGCSEGADAISRGDATEGTTRMDGIRAWMTSNCAQVGPGHSVIDPFAGTGAMLAAARDLGASLVLGSDVVHSSGATIVSDLVGAPVWRGPFDAVVCDPPYGRRAEQVGGCGAAILTALLAWSARVLVLQGRVAFWWWEEAAGAAAETVATILRENALDQDLRLVGWAGDDAGMGGHLREVAWRRCLMVCERHAPPPAGRCCGVVRAPWPAGLRGPFVKDADAAGGGPSEGAGPAFAAAWRGDVAMLREMVVTLRGAAEGGVQVLDAPDEQGRRPLLFAAGYGKVEAVELLCDEAGAAVDAGAGTEHGTALMRAARFGHAPAVQALLARRADPRATDCQGTSATNLAAMFGHLAVLQVLPRSIVGASHLTAATPLHHAAQWGMTKCISLILDAAEALALAPAAPTASPPLPASAGSTSLEQLVNAQGAPRRRTALHLAARFGHAECCALLLARGADASLCDADAATPLDVARASLRPLCVQVLEQASGPVD